MPGSLEQLDLLLLTVAKTRKVQQDGIHFQHHRSKEAVATIVRITRGNLRLIDRLMLQVEHVLLANKLQVVTKEVVETARQTLIIGPG
jgi:hypothetical protein